MAVGANSRVNGSPATSRWSKPNNASAGALSDTIGLRGHHDAVRRRVENILQLRDAGRVDRSLPAIGMDGRAEAEQQRPAAEPGHALQERAYLDRRSVAPAQRQCAIVPLAEPAIAFGRREQRIDAARLRKLVKRGVAGDRKQFGVGVKRLAHAVDEDRDRQLLENGGIAESSPSAEAPALRVSPLAADRGKPPVGGVLCCSSVVGRAGMVSTRKSLAGSAGLAGASSTSLRPISWNARTFVLLNSSPRSRFRDVRSTTFPPDGTAPAGVRPLPFGAS